MRLGDTEKDYYVGALTNPGTSAGAERAPWPGDGAPADAPERHGQRRPQVSDVHAAVLAAAGEVHGGEAVTFWILAPLALIGAIGMVLARNAVHSALWLVLTMLCLGVFYVAAGRAVHRHGADHRLHRRDHDAVPVRADAGRPGRLRLADRDAARPAGRRDRCSGSASPAWSAPALYRALRRRPPRSAWTQANAEGNVQGIARLLFTKYVFAFEVTSALLITAAVGAMVLAHVERRKERQDRPAVDRCGPGSRPGNYPGPKPGPGVFATSDSVATPARLPDGTADRAQHLRRSCRSGS